MSFLCLLLGHRYERRTFDHGWGVDVCIRCGHQVATCRYSEEDVDDC